MKGRDIFVYLESRGIVNNLVNGVLFTGKDFIAAKWNKNTEQADSRSGRCKKRRDAAASDGAIPYLCA